MHDISTLASQELASHACSLQLSGKAPQCAWEITDKATDSLIQRLHAIEDCEVTPLEQTCKRLMYLLRTAQYNAHLIPLTAVEREVHYSQNGELMTRLRQQLALVIDNSQSSGAIVVEISSISEWSDEPYCQHQVRWQGRKLTGAHQEINLIIEEITRSGTARKNQINP